MIMKKLLVLFFSVIMLCALAGCSSEKNKAFELIQGEWYYTSYCEADMKGDIDKATTKYLYDAFDSYDFTMDEKGYATYHQSEKTAENPLVFSEFREETNAYVFTEDEDMYFIIADEPDKLYRLYFFPSESNKSIADRGNYYGRIMSNGMLNKLSKWRNPTTSLMYPGLPDDYLSEGVQIWIYERK